MGRWRSQPRRRCRLRAASLTRAGAPRGNGHRVHPVLKRSWRIAAQRTRFLHWLPLLAVAACSGTTGPRAASPLPGPRPSLEPDRVVTAFLDAANRRDHAVMASYFGTAAGSIGDRGGTLGCAFRKVFSWIGLGDRCLTAQEVELRMDLMAALLAHASYRVGTRATVAGRGTAATRIEVEVDRVAAGSVLVPFVLIQTEEGAWLVEEVDLERLTAS